MNRSVVLRGVGFVVLAASVGWVATRIVAEWDTLSAVSPGARDVAWLVALSAIAGLGMAATIGVWLGALDTVLGAQEATASRRLAAIHALAQIAKYLPGNFVHMAGRHVGTVAALGGGADGPVAKAAFVEAALLVSSALSVAAGAGGIFATTGGTWMSAWSVADGLMSGPVVAVAAIVALACTLAMLAAAPFRRGLGWGSAFFVIQALILTVVVWRVTGEWSTVASVAAPLGWLAGYLTPGAPAGLGVREAVVIGLLGTTMSDVEAIRAALVFRFVSVAGDLAFFVVATVIFRRSRDL